MVCFSITLDTDDEDGDDDDDNDGKDGDDSISDNTYCTSLRYFKVICVDFG